MKRAVKLPYVDFSTIEARIEACRKEYNSLTVPENYLGVKLVTDESAGRFAIDGRGCVCEALVEMVRFDQTALLDNLARKGALTSPMINDLACSIARYHHRLKPVHIIAGREDVAKVIPVSSSIEFNDQIATSDVLYDLAFLIMDLWHRDECEQANRLMNRYLDETDDEEGFALLPLFVARAAVRAHVLATQSTDATTEEALALAHEARAYFALAESSLEPAPPRLIAIGGLSGTGKSTLAEALAPLVGAVPGARIIESDRVRKRMHGVPPETKLPARAYPPEISTMVYREMAWRSRLVLQAGGCIVADAVFDKLRHRTLIEGVTFGRRSAFRGIWLEADPGLLRKRVAAWPHGVSDADVCVVEEQLQHDLSGVTWQKLDASGSIDSVLDQVLGAAATPPLAVDVSI